MIRAILVALVQASRVLILVTILLKIYCMYFFLSGNRRQFNFKDSIIKISTVAVL